MFNTYVLIKNQYLNYFNLKNRFILFFIRLSIQILFHFVGFVQDGFEFNDCFHVHFINFDKGILIALEYYRLILFFRIINDFFARDIPFVFCLSDFFKFFNIS